MATNWTSGIEALEPQKYDAMPVPILTPVAPRIPPNTAVPDWNPPPNVSDAPPQPDVD